MPVGSTTVTFGSFPGTTDIVSTTITGQTSIAGGSAVEAYVFPTSTADHSADEHIVDPPYVMAGSIVAGTGFTIYATPASPGKAYGAWTVNWVWV